MDFDDCEIRKRLNLLYLKRIESILGRVWISFEKAQFKPILIKGWIAAQLYTEPDIRKISDIDLLIAPKDYKKAKEFLESSDDKFSVDLHEGARHLDTVSFDDLFKNSRFVKCGDTNIRVLRPEDHLRILCVHWLTDGGENREKLWDIYYAVANRPKDFDWERCLNTVSERRRRWIICTIGLAHKYLGLYVDDLDFADEIKNSLPEWLIKTIEKEWKSDVPLISLANCLSDRKLLFKQIRKRIPPNPIQATIDMEGDFDKYPRIFYQTGDIFLRLPSSIKRVSHSFLKR